MEASCEKFLSYPNLEGGAFNLEDRLTGGGEGFEGGGGGAEDAGRGLTEG